MYHVVGAYNVRYYYNVRTQSNYIIFIVLKGFFFFFNFNFLSFDVIVSAVYIHDIDQQVQGPGTPSGISVAGLMLTKLPDDINFNKYVFIAKINQMYIIK